MTKIINPFALKAAEDYSASKVIFPELFYHLDEHPLCEMEVNTGTKKRLYTDGKGIAYPSITTLLSATMPADKKKSLQEWEDRVGRTEAQRIRTEAVVRGTAMHELVECYLKDVNFIEEYQNCSPKVKSLFDQVYPELQKIEEIYALENALYSSKIKVAGRVDCIGKYKSSLLNSIGKTSVIDFKTSTNTKEDWMILDYYIQETAYAVMYSEHYPKNKVEQIVTIIATEGDTSATVFVKNPQEYLAPLVKRVKEYYAKNPA